MIDISGIEKKLSEKEAELDNISIKKREVVRLCSNAIKSIHSKDLKSAKNYISEAERELRELKKLAKDYPNHINHILQEYGEARIIWSIVETGNVPTAEDLDMEPEPYLTGLLDAIGEIKREMYESLRHGKKKDAEKYFGIMENIYDDLLPLRFSNSVLPDFRRKQDVARIQIEQARGELL